jgi:phospholipase/carboxylesterase
MDLDGEAVIWHERRDDLPRLVLMHGRGSNEYDLAGFAPMLDGAWCVASVRAVLPEGIGFSWFPPGVSGDPAAEAADAAADAVLAWLDALPPAPLTGVLGFSQGGAMAIHLLRRAPERISFAINLAGFVVRGAQPGDARLRDTRPPVFFGRGVDDMVVPSEAFARTDEWLPGHSDPAIRRYADLGHSISPEELRDVVTFLDARLAAR